MMDLTQLEGFELTKYELMVASSPSFQRLRERVWPFKWGELITGFKAESYRDYHDHDAVFFTEMEKDLLSPHAVGKLFDQFASDCRSVYVMVSKIIRDAKLSNGYDLLFFQDLNLWLDGDRHFTGFRWERHVKKLEEEAQYKAWKERMTELKRGSSDVVVIFLSRLLDDERQQLKWMLWTKCIERGIFTEEDREAQRYHMPRTRCLCCHEHESRQNNYDCLNSIVLVDCGDVPTILKDIDRKIQGLINICRFKVPHSTFCELIGNRKRIFPSFVVYGLNLLPEGEKQRKRYQSISELQDWHKQKQFEERHYDAGSKYHSFCKIILPAGHQKPNAVLFAGHLVNDSYYWSGANKLISASYAGGNI